MEKSKEQALLDKLKAKAAAFEAEKAAYTAANVEDHDDEQTIAAFPDRDIKKNLGCGG